MTAILRVVAITLFALAGSWEVRADDRLTCYMANSNDWTNSEKYDAAILACDRLISYTKGHVQAAAYRTRGYWKHKKGNSQSALEDFDTGIRLDPHQVEGYNYRGEVLRDIGDLDRALADYETVIRIDPNYSAAYFNRGYLYEMKGDIAAARGEYNRALATPSSGPNKRLTEWAHNEARKRLDALGPQSHGSGLGPNDHSLTTGR